MTRPKRAAKQQLCLRPGCERLFVTRAPNQRYCTPRCQQLVDGGRLRGPRWDRKRAAIDGLGRGDRAVPRGPHPLVVAADRAEAAVRSFPSTHWVEQIEQVIAELAAVRGPKVADLIRFALRSRLRLDTPSA